jgi:hypothetical protein
MDPSYFGAVNQGLQIPPKGILCQDWPHRCERLLVNYSIMKYLLPHIAENRRLSGRQIGEAGRLNVLRAGAIGSRASCL